MPDYSFIANQQQQNPLTTIGSMLNLARGSLDYQKAQDTYDSDVAAAKAQSQSAQSKATVDAANVQPDIQRRQAELQLAQTQAQQAKLKMSGDLRATLGGLYGVLGRAGVDDPSLVAQEMDRLATQVQNPDFSSYVQAAKVGLANLPAGQGLVKKTLVTQSQSLLSPAEQNALGPQPGTMNLGTDIVPTVTQPSVGGNAPSITVGATPIAQAQITPGSVSSVSTDQSGNPISINRTKSGAIGSITPIAVGAEPAKKPFFLPAGETPDTLKQVQGIRSAANTAATTVPQQQWNTNKIIHYADATITGRGGAELLQGLQGGFAAIPWTTDSATNYNLLGHTMAQQTATLAQSAGLNGTNAARDLAAEQTADKKWTADAIKTSARTMRALSTGTELFNQGIEKAVAGGDPFAARSFQNKWSLAAGTGGIDAMRLYDAFKNRQSDPDGLKATVKDLGGPDGVAYKKALKKVDELKALINGAQ